MNRALLVFAFDFGRGMYLHFPPASETLEYSCEKKKLYTQIDYEFLALGI